MKRIILILVFLAAGGFAWYQYNARQERLRAAAEAVRRAQEAERQKAEAEKRRAEEEARRAEEARRKAEEARRAEEEAKRRGEEENVRKEREAARKAEAEERARQEARQAAERFVSENVTVFAKATAAFAEQAPRSERFGGKGLTATFRLFLPGTDAPRFMTVAFEKGKVVRAEEHAYGKDPAAVAPKELKAALTAGPWVSCREGSDVAVYHGFTGSRAELRLQDFWILNPSLKLAVETKLEPYGRLSLGTVGFTDLMQADEMQGRVRAAIEACLKERRGHNERNRRVVFYDGTEVRHRGSLHEVPRRFLRDNLRDIRAAREGKRTNWKLARERRRRQRAEWLDLFEEAEMREKGVKVPLAVVVPEADVARAVQQAAWRFSPAPLAKKKAK